MNLREDIQRIQEVMGIKVSNLFKRKLHIIEKLIYSLIEDSMYPCDFSAFMPSSFSFLHRATLLLPFDH